MHGLAVRRVAHLGGLAACMVLGCSGGCDDDASSSPTPSAIASAGLTALSPQLKSKVLAKVGDREITLGEYAATLERMGEFERLRYQSPDRRKVLLEEIIQVELLANEAKRLGLDKKPETRARLRQTLRDELLRQERAKLPKPSELSAAEVRAYYDAHKEQFQEPERRRVAQLVLGDEERARQILDEAREADAVEWGALVLKHSSDRRPLANPSDPVEFAGDLGIVTRGNQEGNDRVPEAVRKAVFEIEKIGGVYSELVRVDKTFRIVRMLGKTDARTRSLEESERAIRVRLLEQRAEKLERELEKRLRDRFEVVVDDEALRKVKLPASSTKK